MLGIRHDLCRELPAGTPASGLGFESFPGAQQFLTVWGGSTWGGIATGTQARPFLTIGAAVAAAAALLPTAVNRIMIMVWPGTYNEQVVLANDYVDLVGVDRDSCVVSFANAPGAATLRVTADAVRIERMTFLDTADGYPAYFSAPLGAARASVHDCRFHSALGAYTRIGSESRVDFTRCSFEHAFITVTALRFTQDSGSSTVYDCTVRGRSGFDGAGDVTFVGNTCTAQDPSPVIYTSTTGSIIIQACSLTGIDDHAISIAVQPAALAILDNYLVCGDQHNSVYASLAVTGIRIENNIMFVGGIHGNVSHVDPVKWVGASGMKDWYGITQSALDACTYDDCVIKLLRDEVLVAALTPPSRPVTIDGHGRHRLTRAAGAAVCTVGAADNLVLRDLEAVGSLDVNGDGAALTLEHSYLTGMIDVIAGDATTVVSVLDSVILGDAADLYALRIRDADPTVTGKRSRMKATAAQPALMWDIVNAALNLKECQVLHGTPAVGSNPFGQAGGLGPITYDAHQCSFNDDPDLVAGSIWTNNTPAGQRFNTIDVGVDY